MKSRNQREGKFIPGWCYNPAYKSVPYKGFHKHVPKTRAGQHFDLKAVRNFDDYGYTIPGVTYVRTVREGAFE